MPALKPLPANHGNQILELFCVCRNHGKGQVEIAEHADGAMKAYAEKWRADDAAMEMRMADGKDWDTETIWLLHKGTDVCPEAMALAETGMFSEQAVRSVDSLMTTLRRRG
jgi:hypothetical protein